MTNQVELKVECITDTETFLACRRKWNQFVTTLAGHSCFSHHEWFSAAWSWRSLEGCSLRILFFHHNDELVGICPLILNRFKYRAFAFRQLEFLTTPDTQFCGLICERQWLPAVSDTLADWLHTYRRDWTLMRLAYLDNTPTVLQTMVESLQKLGFMTTGRSFGSNLYINLTGPWEDYYKGRSRRLKKGNNLVANKIKKDGIPRIEWIRGRHERRELQHYLDTLIRLSSGSWKKTTGLSLDQPGPGAFIETLSHLADKNGWLSLWILYLDNQPIAMEYQLIHEGIVYALRADFDETYAHLSPGTYLNWQLLQSLFGQGLERYYMGPGENAYKQRWTDDSQALMQLAVYNNTGKGKFCAALFTKLLPALRHLSDLPRKFIKRKVTQ